jgi:LysR family transcriptional regulator for metE and metH
MRIAAPKPKLDVRDLELVLAIAASGSTVSAAATLHVTQSAVSRGLLLAEEKLGVRLFDRSARGLRPTTAGEQMVRGATPLLAQLVALERQVETPAPEAVRLRIACECYTAYRWLPSTLATLQRTLPGLNLMLAPEFTERPVAGLLAGDLDVALLTTASVPSSLTSVPLFSDEVVFVVAADHPLAARASITRRDLGAYPLITSSQTPDAERRWFAAHTFGRSLPKIMPLQFPLTEAIIDAARAGMGIAVMSEWIAGPYLDRGDVVMKRLSGRPLLRPWRMAFRPELSATSSALRAALERSAPRVRSARAS